MHKKIKLTIPECQIDEPILYKIVSEYKLIINIIEASLGSGSRGVVILEIKGTPIDLEKGLLYLKEKDVYVEEL